MERLRIGRWSKHGRQLTLVCLFCLCSSCQKSNNKEEMETDSDRPEGWEDAVAVDLYWGPYQGEYDFGEIESFVAAGARGGQVYLVYENGVYEAGPDYKAYVRTVSGKYEVLIQPEVMDPAGVSGTSSRTIRLLLGPGEEGTEVEVFRRNHRLSDPKGKVISEGRATAGGAEGDRITASCDSVVDCEALEDPDAVQTWGCFQVRAWSEPTCLWDDEACWLECGYALRDRTECHHEPTEGSYSTVTCGG
jgi:hypothetical protein